MEENNAVELSTVPTKEEKKALIKEYAKGAGVAFILFMAIQIISATVGGMIGLFGGIIVGIKNASNPDMISKTAMEFFQSPLTIAIMNIVSLCIAYPLAMLISKGVTGYKLKSLITKPEGNYAKYFGIVWVFILAGNAVATLVSFLFDKIGITFQTVDTSTMFENTPAMILNFITVCILAPIFEEIFLRGFALRKLLDSSKSPFFAIIVTGILFSAIHGNVPQILGVFPLGIFLGYVAYKTGSVIPCIILHAINNITAFIYGGIQIHLIGKFGEELASKYMLIGEFVLMGALTILAVILIIKNKKNYVSMKETPEIKARTFPLLFKVWSFDVMIVLAVLMSILMTSATTIAGKL